MNKFLSLIAALLIAIDSTAQSYDYLSAKKMLVTGPFRPGSDTAQAPFWIGEIRQLVQGDSAQLFVGVSKTAPKKWYKVSSSLYTTRSAISLTTSGTSGAATYNDATGVFNIPNYATGGGGGVTAALPYEYSATALTDTAKVWIKTPTRAAVYDVYRYFAGQWRPFGWIDSVHGVFSQKRPLTVVISGQSNAAGGVTGMPEGDTSIMRGIIGYGRMAQNTGGLLSGLDTCIQWVPVQAGRSPLYQVHNNIAFQFAKNAIRTGKADIVRIVTAFQGGTSIDAWIDKVGTINGTQILDTLRSRLTRSGVDTIDVFLWQHGESTALHTLAEGSYWKDLTVLMDSLGSPLTQGYMKHYTRFIAGGVGTTDGRTEYNAASGNEGYLRRLNEDARQLTAFYYSWRATSHDGTHFDGPGIDTMGLRAFNTYLSMPRNMNDDAPKAKFQTWDPTVPISYQSGNAQLNLGTTSSIGWYSGTSQVFRITSGTPSVGAQIGNTPNLSTPASSNMKTHNMYGHAMGQGSWRMYPLSGENYFIENYNISSKILHSQKTNGDWIHAEKTISNGDTAQTIDAVNDTLLTAMTYLPSSCAGTIEYELVASNSTFTATSFAKQYIKFRRNGGAFTLIGTAQDIKAADTDAALSGITWSWALGPITGTPVLAVSGIAANTIKWKINYRIIYND